MAKKKLNSLDALQSVSFGEKKKKRPKHERVVEKVRERLGLVDEEKEPSSAKDNTPRAEPDDEHMFFSAMQGVAPLDESQGRQIAPESAPPAPAPSSIDEDAKEYLDKFVRGEVDFELEFTEEYMHGYVKGLDAKTFNQLKAGTLSHEGHLDLHGMNAEQAYDAMVFFLKESYLQGRRCVLLVTGRGINSPGGQGILRRSVQNWLTREPLKRVVLAFCTARAADGGAGALYVLLRKQRKSQGKIHWDRSAFFSD
ncbi:DNA-nicking endonuclease, Smr domain [Paucidesulfovibrio gracilis DSM 16080]|uniref:DNA-nicking endonuclease, Smr domain n=1 Tax=Paucidesulfovibrio gracilis DSM 16080 TaxID=1121449 RepID=A0A1T4XWJ7_9BACT|nr:Smr/MutS family protein [Paucidesulfovibrio gracilis]SKA93884.1 DNA-nicking endonuclease, Smr domain [Paucidesulfovibrio gracilis DSM 16080]